MRLTNIDTVSALFDRLITERIKWYFFSKDGDSIRTQHQLELIELIRNRIAALLHEIYETGKYQYLGERRTFNLDDIVGQLDALTVNDINIGEADRLRLKELTSPEPSLEKFLEGERLLRISNETRSINKNNIDNTLKQHFEYEDL